MDIYAFCDRGGGITSANPIELSTICTPNAECKIDATYKDKSIENHNPIEVSQIELTTSIAEFTNYSDITSNSSQTFSLLQNGTLGNITHFVNHGNISGGIEILNTTKVLELGAITNYGTMRGVWTRYHPITITINNFGTITTNQGTYYQGFEGNKAAHFAFESKEANLIIENYKITISETQGEFNAFEGYYDKTNNKNSHLIIMYNAHIPTAQNVYFKDANSKLILDFSDEFELGKGYLISKLVTNRLGNNISALPIDFSRLTLSDERKDIYELVSSGDYFIIRLLNQITETPITAIYKSNIRTMNNFWTLSNSMIYPRKSYHSQNLGKKNLSLRASEYERGNPFALSSLRASEYERGNLFIKESLDSALDSANPLKSYESFSYRNESVNRRIQRQNKRNYNRKTTNAESSVKSQGGLPRATSRTRNDNFNNSVNESQNLNDYYFILTPFINYNSFNKSGNYNLSGFDYGFLTAFSAQIAESNHLGTHFIFSYGKLGDSKDKDLSIKSLNLNIGLNYKLDLIWDMYLKARGDFFYFLNAIDSLTIKNIKPNNLGFGLSVSYGKDFDFKSGGVLGLEAGIDYKALKTNEVLLNSQNYKQSLLNLIYVDLGINYNKYFDSFGINLGTGFKANLAPRLAKSTLLINTHNLTFTIDNDKYLAYANAGISYVINTKNFDMEFSLQYFGNFGDRGISNGGGVEWRVFW